MSAPPPRGAARKHRERMNNPENFRTRWSRRKHAAVLGREEIVSSVAPSAAPLGEAPGNERTAGTERLDDGSGILTRLRCHSIR